MNRLLNFAGIIPARYASTRFPGKPLAIIGNRPMIQMVYEKAAKSLPVVFVATDDQRIYDTVKQFGGRAVMTSTAHRSGTDRCEEAAEFIAAEGYRIDVIINIQGDEPFIRSEQIDLLKQCFSDEDVEIATLIRKVNSGEDITDPNRVKAIRDLKGDAIYFSRQPIPYMRGEDIKLWPSKHTYYKHIGLYAYRHDVLKKITSLSQTGLEIAESLEQNRWLENGFRIRTAVTRWENIGIDTPDDLEKAQLLADQYE
jgi:3-deoxy-manno-octulosonate cytidylyltransferase (CMP-KDO synthetase)